MRAGYVEVADGWAKGRTGRVLEVIERPPGECGLRGSSTIEVGAWEHRVALVRIRDELGIFIVPINVLGECFRYYLGEQVHPIEGLVEDQWAPLAGIPLFKSQPPDKWPDTAAWPPEPGWVAAEWPDERVFLFLREQIKTEAWGSRTTEFDVKNAVPR